jgi:hypothetical protein
VPDPIWKVECLRMWMLKKLRMLERTTDVRRRKWMVLMTTVLMTTVLVTTVLDDGD